MTQSDHEKERRAFWDACCAQTESVYAENEATPTARQCAEWCAEVADAKLAERDKRFMAPKESEGK